MTTLSRRAALGLLAASAGSLAIGSARAYEFIDYTPQAHAAIAATGRGYILDFYATWCSTCAVQHRVMKELRAGNAAYAAIPIIQVDWDQNLDGPLVAALAIPRRSTIVVMQGDTELARVVARVQPEIIEGLFKLALDA